MNVIAERGARSMAGVAAGRARSIAGWIVKDRDRTDAWVGPALVAVAALAAILSFVNLTVSGYANTYYSMAAQAASQNWTAWLFGSLDASNFITVDKPPLATMIMGLSVRLLGLNSFAILAPQALMGVATVVVLFLAVRKSFGPVAATIAGVVAALSPAAVLIFRYNNPDALLTLLLVGAAWALLRALDAGRLRWLVLAGALVGLGFNTKFLQAFLVLPAFALVWVVVAPGGVRRRAAGLAVALASVLLTSFSWAVAVDLIPAANRPYVGGSTSNSALDLLFGYAGLGRIFGMTGPGGGGGAPGGGANFGGDAGILRLLNSQFGGEIAWLIPFALIALVGGLVLRGRANRMDSARAGYLLWGGWLAVTALVFSFMSGVVHPYYAVALAPAIGALVGAGVVELWRLRQRSMVGGLLLAAAFLASGLLAMVILDRTPAFLRGLGVGIVAVSVAAALVVAVPAARIGRRLGLAAVALGLAAALAGPAAYAVSTMGSSLSGGDPVAGPMTSGMGGGSGVPGGTEAANAALVDYLAANRGDARWIVAVSGSGSAAAIQLASGLPVMTMGGFGGGDAAPTLAELQAYVASGELRFVLASAGGFPGGASPGGGFPGGASPGGGFPGGGSPGGPVPGGGFPQMPDAAGGRPGDGSVLGGPMGGGSQREVISWVTTSCTLVDSATSGTSDLYDCAGAAGS